MKRLFIFFFLCASILQFSLGVAAQDYPKKMSFRNIMQNQDIAMGEVEAIIQDHEGFMWLGGSNALLRYDGYEFLGIPIAANDAKKGSEPQFVKLVVDLFEDSHKQLWISTRDGLLKYDRAHEVARRLSWQDGKTIKIVRTLTLAEAPGGEMLVGTYDGLIVFDPVTDIANVIAHVAGDVDSLPNNTVRNIVVDKNGIIWLATDAGLVRMEWPSRKMTLISPYPANPASLPDNAVRTMAQDKEGNLWLGVVNGLYKFNPESGAIKRYQHDPNNQHSLAHNLIRDIFVDKNGWVWSGSDAGGLSLYDAANDRFIRFRKEDGSAGSLSSNTIRRIYQDDAGDMWVGTYPSGLNFHDHSTEAISVYRKELEINRGLLDNNVEAVIEDGDGNLWIGAGGVTRYNPVADSFIHYQKPDNDIASPRIFNSTSAISALYDRDGDIWFGTWGLSYHRYNKKTDSFEQLPFDASLSRTKIKTSTKLIDSVVWGIYQDKQKNLWLGTHNSGVTQYDKKTGQYTNYEPTQNDPTSISTTVVWTMFEDSAGRFWVGTANGLNLLDRENGIFKRYFARPDDPQSLVNDSILSIYEDKKNRLWFGTNRGLHLFHPETDNFTVYNTTNGFIDNGIRAVTEDQFGNLWLGSNNGVIKFNPDTKIVRNYVRYNGEKIGGIATGAARATRKGEIVFGTKSGLYVFDVNKLMTNEKVPPIVLTDFRIFTKKILTNDVDKILTKAINQTDQVTLDYTKSMISFSFSALNYRDSDKNQYAYKLEGFDDKWREVGNQRTALYTNLDAGNYIFKVKASNNDGIWNETGKSIKVTQLPPPWKTWWAYLIYLLAVLAIIIQFVHSQRKKRRLVEQQNRLLEIKVAERTAELREKNNDIQAMLSNIPQGLFTIEVGGNIHPEYSRFLENIFETTEIAGRNVMSLLFAGANLGGDTLASVSAAIKSMIGEDKINYEFNSHLLITAYEVNLGVKRKYLSLDWSPIVSDNDIVKLMVSVRDVTLLKQLESEALTKKRELEIISQLLNVSAKKYLAFATSTKRFIAENRDAIKSSEHRNDSAIALLFRNMHTIKGNCRTFGFRFFSDVVHEVESAYSALIADTAADWNREQLLAGLARVENLLYEFEYINYSVLGRGVKGKDQEGFWADTNVINVMQNSIDSANKKFPALEEGKELFPIQKLLNIALTIPLNEVLADIISSLASIATQLNKPAPQVVVDDNHVRIRSTATELLTNIFAHILRNCVDHGIEAPAVRLERGKPASGKIEVRAVVIDERLYLRVKDDGQGIDIDKLFNEGVELGQWTATDTPDYQAIANLIFASGVSTKEQVSDISGRGVGMEAVKHFLLAHNATITLKLLGPQAEGNSYGCGVKVPFELNIELPAATFIEVV
ncbi:MAG: two-component regulator propeller domain-containing protein [Pseudomonadota bacterium]